MLFPKIIANCERLVFHSTTRTRRYLEALFIDFCRSSLFHAVCRTPLFKTLNLVLLVYTVEISILPARADKMKYVVKVRFAWL